MASNPEIKLSKNWKWLYDQPDEIHIPCAHKECFLTTDK